MDSGDQLPRHHFGKLQRGAHAASHQQLRGTATKARYIANKFCLVAPFADGIGADIAMFKQCGDFVRIGRQQIGHAVNAYLDQPCCGFRAN